MVTQPAPTKKRRTFTDAERASKLKELASSRMPRALRALKVVGNLARYNPNERQRDAILTALRKELARVEAAFSGHTQAEFDLPT